MDAPILRGFSRVSLLMIGVAPGASGWPEKGLNPVARDRDQKPNANTIAMMMAAITAKLESTRCQK